MLKNYFITVIFNAPLDSGLDYANQTMEVLSQENVVVGYCLGEPITWKDSFLLVLGKKKIIQKIGSYTIFRPFFIIPGRRFRFIQEINYILSGLLIALFGIVKYYKAKKIVWFFEPFHIPPLLSIFHKYISVYDCVDYYSGFSSYARKSEISLLHRVTYVFANSKVLTQFLGQFRDDVVTVPQGFSRNVFETYIKKGNKIKKTNKFTVGYVGGINSRLDFNLLFRTAQHLPNIHFFFIGPIEENVFEVNEEFSQHMHELFSLPNVFLKSPVKKDKIPEAIDSFDVGLIPYLIENSFNKYCFPMKVMEYFYLGCPVVSTPIEELKRFKKLIHFGKTPDSTIKRIIEIQKNPPSKFNIAEMKQTALAHDWNIKLNRISNYIQKNNHMV